MIYVYIYIHISDGSSYMFFSWLGSPSLWIQRCRHASDRSHPPVTLEAAAHVGPRDLSDSKQMGRRWNHIYIYMEPIKKKESNCIQLNPKLFRTKTSAISNRFQFFFSIPEAVQRHAPCRVT